MALALAVLVAFQLAGEITVRLLGLTVPGPVVGLVLLYAALVARGRVPRDLRAASTGLLQHLTLFLVPATTGLMLHVRRLGDEALPIVLATAGGSAVTMALTALTLRLLAGRKRMP